MRSIPHPIPYQGSKRRLAEAILSQMPQRRLHRLVEPFAGSAAITLAAASRCQFECYLLADALEPLCVLWQRICSRPLEIADGYQELWQRERRLPIIAFYEIRSEFNNDRDPAKLLYLLARCVKNAVRFNPSGEFNQSPDKRRKGTHPERMRAELLSAYELLGGRCTVENADFMDMFCAAKPGDFFYLDPPYQGTSNGRDQRYIAGVTRERMIEGLEFLNAKEIPFILSYDGSSGERTYGEPLPRELAKHLLLDVGRSSQATLNGSADRTVESIYVSHSIAQPHQKTMFALADFAPQAALFG